MPKPDLENFSFEVAVPSILLFNKNVEPSAIKLYCIIKGLTRISGYCYATNQYLAESMEASEQSVRRLLKSLKDEGFLDIKTSKKGIHWQRHIYLGNGLNKSLRRTKNEHPPAQKRAPPCSKISTILEEYTITSSSVPSEEGYTKGLATPQKSLYEGKFENKIKITEEQKSEVIKNLNCSEEVFESTVERLYDYSLNKPQEFKKYKRHDITVKNWIQRDSKKTSYHKPADPNQTQLNPAQMSNWKLNEKMVTELKSQMPDKSNGLYFFYKHYILKDKNNPQFDLCAYIDHKDFCRLLGNNVKLRITPFEGS